MKGQCPFATAEGETFALGFTDLSSLGRQVLRVRAEELTRRGSTQLEAPHELLQVFGLHREL